MRYLGLVLAGVLAAGTVASANPLLLLGVPSPGDVIKLIDSLTKNDSSTKVDVKLGATVQHGKLLVARGKVDVALERSSKNWRGRVQVQMQVPTEISYSVDLAGLKREHVRLDAAKRVLVVRMPAVKVEDVTPTLPAVTHEDKYKAARFKFFDKDTSRELQNAMLLHDYQAKAREAGEAAVGQVREESKAAFGKFLEKLLAGTAAGVKVVVE